MVDAQDERAAARVVVDEVELPERLGEVEGRGREIAHERLELRLVRRAGQGGAVDVGVEVEIAVVLPPGAGRVLQELERTTSSMPFLSGTTARVLPSMWAGASKWPAVNR